MKTVTVKPKTRSLTTTLAISFFSLSALVLFISSSLQILLSIQAQQAEIKEKQQLIAQDAGKSVSSFIETRFNTMETAAEFSNLATASYEERITAMQGMLGIDPAFKQINMLNSGGFQQAFVSRTSQTASGQFTSQITGSIYAAMSMGERFFIGPIYFDENTSEPLITLGLPYKTPVGDYQGILATEVSLKFIWDLVDQIKVGETGYVYVVDNQGNLIAYKDTSRVLQGENVRQISEVSEFLQNPSATTAQTLDIQTYTGLNGETVLGTYVPLGTPQWAVVIELPWKEAYQNIISLAWQSMALILIIALLAGLVGYLGARRTSAPLVDLSNVATDIANGNLNARAKETGALELVQLASSFNNMTSLLRDSIGNLELRVSERTQALAVVNQQSERRAKQFEAIAQVARSITSTQNFDILLPQVANLLSREFGFYHVGIFLLDPRKEYAVLTASNSVGGQRMLERNHRLKVGEIGLVSYVTSIGKARVALDTNVDAVFIKNPDLPETRSEIALPLLVGNEVIGALDVQSDQPNAFDQEDINILSTLADQVSIAIQNARQYEETRRALAESESLSRQFVQTGWQQFAKSHNLIGIRHTGAKATLLYAKNKKGKGDDESSLNREQARAKARGATLSLPVKLRGEVIGSVDVRSQANRQFDQDELDIVTAIIERAAIAMENARLLEEAQRRASKEQAIGEITANISAASEVEKILQTTVEELGRRLSGTSGITIEMTNITGKNTTTKDKTKRS